MKKFVPHAHSRLKFFWPIGVVLAGFVVVPGFFINLLRGLIAGALLFLGYELWLLLAEKYETTRGLIVDAEKLLYKGLWKRPVDVQRIVAIKIARASTTFKCGDSPLNDIKDREGNQLYSMFFLTSYMPWTMAEKEGEPWVNDQGFQHWFREYIICRLVYDQEVIDYLLRLNPDIVVF